MECCMDLPWQLGSKGGEVFVLPTPIDINSNKQRTRRKIPSYSPKWNEKCLDVRVLYNKFYQNLYRMYIIVSFNPMQRSTITALPYSKLGHFFGDSCAVICDHWIIALRNHEISSHIIQFGTFFVYRSPGQRWQRPSSAMWLAACKLCVSTWAVKKRNLVGWFPLGIALPYQLLLDYKIDHSENPCWPTSRMGGDTVEFFFPCFNVIQLGFTAFRMSSYFLQSIPFFWKWNINKNRNHIEVPGSERIIVGVSDMI